MAFVIVSALIFLFTTHARAASIQPETFNPKTVSTVIDSFSLKLLAKMSDVSGASNLALSPYLIWTLLAIIHEGARNHTATELEHVLGIPSCEQASCLDNFRQRYRQLSTLLSGRARDITLDLANEMFVENTLPVNPAFEEVSRNVYDVSVMPIDFGDKPKAAKHINQQLAEKTGQRINDFVNADGLQDTVMVLTSVLYFKGLWQTPFNKTDTRKETFFDEYRKPMAEVDMMYLKTPLPFTTLFDRKATAVELKYGDGDRISMIVIVPKWNSSLSEILAQLVDTPIGKILDALTASAEQFVDENVIVHLPRFTIKSDFVMNSVLEDMGIKDMFNSRAANLSGISMKILYVSQVLQRAVIQVEEDGRVATAAEVVTVETKPAPTELKANRPFVYFIVDNPTQTVLFTGTVQNPNV